MGLFWDSWPNLVSFQKRSLASCCGSFFRKETRVLGVFSFRDLLNTSLVKESFQESSFVLCYMFLFGKDTRSFHEWSFLTHLTNIDIFNYICHSPSCTDAHRWCVFILIMRAFSSSSSSSSSSYILSLILRLPSMCFDGGKDGGISTYFIKIDMYFRSSYCSSYLNWCVLICVGWLGLCRPTCPCDSLLPVSA